MQIKKPNASLKPSKASQNKYRPWSFNLKLRTAHAKQRQQAKLQLQLLRLRAKKDPN